MPIYIELLRSKPIIDKSELKTRLKYNNNEHNDRRPQKQSEQQPELIIDLFSPTFIGFGGYIREDILYSTDNIENIKRRYSIRTVDTITVEYPSRPDLLFPTSPNMWWKILKYNGISNPFYIYEGMDLYIPLEQDFDNNINPNTINLSYVDYTSDDVQEQVIDEGQNIKNRMKQILNEKPKQSPVNIVGDKIVFGDTQCQEPKCIVRPLSRGMLKRIQKNQLSQPNQPLSNNTNNTSVNNNNDK